jgi:hypothetical protein
MKVVKSSKISPFGGINYVLNEFERLRIRELVNNELPALPKQVRYSWYDLLASYWSVFFCGGDCAEDLSVNLKEGLNGNPFIHISSPDRILERLKSLSTPSVFVETKRGKSINEFSVNLDLNRLNLKLLNRLDTFKKKDVVLDYDNTLIFAEKADARFTYKKEKGYSPGVGMVGKHVVYVENRNGNSAAHILQDETFKRMAELLEQEGITIKSIRADSASYGFEIIKTMRQYAQTIFVRARMNACIEEAIAQIDTWEKINVAGQEMYRGSTLFTPFKKAAKEAKYTQALEEYRLIVTKEKRIDGQINLFTGEPYNYSAIMTNDFEMTNDEVVFFYNARGAEEREFDELKNDFGWNNMPFSQLEQNTVFLIITAMCKNLYQYIIHRFSQTIACLKPNYRIKKFIFRFICTPGKWFKQGRTMKLRIYGDIVLKT